MKTIKRDEVLEYINDNIYNSRVADSYEELKLFCEVEGINATKQTIKSFLIKKAKEEGVDLNALNSETKVIDLVNIDDNLIKRSADRFMQEITAAKYKYHREDLQYFNDLFRIYTTKCLKICNIISMIAGRRLLDKNLMKELDITINEKEVLISDINRLLVPLKCNYILALDVKNTAEQMDTYLKLNIDKVALNKECVCYREYLPSTELQDYFGERIGKEEFIPLTEKQKKEIDEQTIANFSCYLEEDIDN